MTVKDKIILDDVAAYVVGVFPTLNLFEQHLSLELYRLLGEGQPVPRARLAQLLESTVENVNNVLDGWPAVFSDQQRQVVGYWGLSIPTSYASPHKIKMGDQTLSAWCAWDTLFLPQLLGQTAEIESTGPGGLAVHLTVMPERVERVDSVSTHVSFLMPNAAEVLKDPLRTFCHFVHFFPSQGAGESWVKGHPGTFILSIDDAYDLARRKNQALYRDALI